jgi:hypothetical protein
VILIYQCYVILVIDTNQLIQNKITLICLEWSTTSCFVRRYKHDQLDEPNTWKELFAMTTRKLINLDLETNQLTELPFPFRKSLLYTNLLKEICI